MSRQFRRTAPASCSKQCGPVARRRRGVGRAAAALATALLLGWNSTVAPDFAAAQQTPGTWSVERRAVLPSGLAVEMEFSPLPGVSSTATPGSLAARTGTASGGTRPGGIGHRGNENGGKGSASGASTPGTQSSVSSDYADGLRSGEPAETFRIAEERPQADGSWRTMGTLRISFSRAVRNPRLHLSGLAGLATGKTAPPSAPVLALPEFTNDPGLLLTGTADPDTTVSVTDAPAAPGAARSGGELCSTAVAADRTWSCLPVENLADGRHQITATAVDEAGNRTAGTPVTLVVDTAAPERPTPPPDSPGAPDTSAAPPAPPALPAMPAMPEPPSVPVEAVPAVPPAPSDPVPAATREAPASTALPGDPNSASTGRSPSGSPPPSVPAPPSPSGAPSAVPSGSPGKAVEGPASALAAPPGTPRTAVARRSATDGWRSVLCAGLLVLSAIGLVTRRILGRGSGSRRR
ncbi:Ig-like domain-containing protein [Kitasatospora sp. GP82]|uniref:Ig-like domain-containing protein n=1 Tax=Kitasatospora sp. GP82 TaxID=3035089 RepID=UPI0024771DBC|nr:Ig-like domain-containing protein [Kitasatospora sp. GP82]MDH6123541.1 hypothetical protein [Kitasatospora sp. GP82]